MKIDLSASVTTDMYGADALVSAQVRVSVPEIGDVKQKPERVATVEAIREAVHARLAQLRKEIDAQLDAVAEQAGARERERRRVQASVPEPIGVSQDVPF